MTRRNQRREKRAESKSRRNHLLALAGILLLAGLLRFWQLGSFPPGLYHDEAYNGLDALSLIQGNSFPQYYEGWELYAADAHAGRPAQDTQTPIFFEGNYGREPLHIYLMSLSIRLFGASPFALRAVPAAAGVLAVFTTYLAALALLRAAPRPDNNPEPAGWPLPPPTLALLAALFVALFFPAIHFSRFGLRVMLFLPLETLTVYCFWNAIDLFRRRRAGDSPKPRTSGMPGPGRVAAWFGLAGFCLGLGVYTYAAARLLPLLFMLFIPLWLWQEPAARRQWPGILLMAGAALATALPLLIFFARYPYFLVFRTAFVANKGVGTFPGRPWLTWLNNIWRVFRGFFWQGETHLRHNLPGRAYLDSIQALFFIFGFVGAVRARFRLRAVFIFLWLGIMLLPTLFSGDAPHFGRMSGAVPPVAVLVAIGTGWLWQWLARRDWRRNLDGPRLATVIIGLGFLLSGILTLVDYFGRYAQHPDLPTDFYQDDWLLGLAAAAEPAGTVLYLSPSQEEMATIYFALNGDTRRMADYYGPGGVVPAGQPGLPTLYFVRPDDPTTLQRLRDFFPDGEVEQEANNAVPFRVPASAPRLPGVNPTDAGFRNPAGEGIALLDWVPFLENDQLFITFYWQAASPLATNYTAFVHLVDEEGNLVTQLDRPPAGYPTSDWRPGEIVADQFLLLLPADLPAGDYSIRTGFYDGQTREPLGEATILGRVEIR